MPSAISWPPDTSTAAANSTWCAAASRYYSSVTVCLRTAVTLYLASRYSFNCDQWYNIHFYHSIIFSMFYFFMLKLFANKYVAIHHIKCYSKRTSLGCSGCGPMSMKTRRTSPACQPQPSSACGLAPPHHLKFFW